MKNTGYLIYRLVLSSAIVLACLSGSVYHAFAQSAEQSETADGSVETAPLEKFDFGVPNPYADRSKVVQPIDFLKTA